MRRGGRRRCRGASLPCRYGCIRPRFHVSRTEIGCRRGFECTSTSVSDGYRGGGYAVGWDPACRTVSSTSTARDPVRRSQVPKRGHGRYRSAADAPIAASQALQRSLCACPTRGCAARVDWRTSGLHTGQLRIRGAVRVHGAGTLQVNAAWASSDPLGASPAGRSQGFPANVDCIIYDAPV